MGYGQGPPNYDHKGSHRWMRIEKVGNTERAVPVGLRALLPSDFCSFCRLTREDLQQAPLPDSEVPNQ